MSSELGISSIADLHRVTTGTHDDVRDMLSDPQASGDSLRKDFSRFYFAFKGIKQCSADTAAAVTMYHASRVSQGFKLRVNQALQAGIGAGIVEIEVMAAAAAADTRRLPDKQATYDQLEFMANGDWIGLLNLTVAVLCHDDNKERTFEEKRQPLMQADLSGFQRH